MGKNPGRWPGKRSEITIRRLKEKAYQAQQKRRDPTGPKEMIRKYWTAAILLLVITAAAIGCGTDPGAGPGAGTPPATSMAETIEAPVGPTSERPSPEAATATEHENEDTDRKPVEKTVAATEEASTATPYPWPTNTPVYAPGQEKTGLRMHPNNSHQPFDPVNGPTGTEEELIAEIDFVIQVHLEHLFKTPPDHEANRLLQGRLSEDFRRACKPREMWGALANEYRNVHHAEGRDNHNVEDLPEKITHSVEILEFDGHTATARLHFHSGENTYEQYRPAPMDHWIYLEGTPGEANRWAMEPKDIATRRHC